MRRGRFLGGRLALLLGFLLSLLPDASSAREQGLARAQLLSASRLYEELEYERALDALAQARRISRKKAEAVTIWLYEGVILANLGKKDAANTAFKAALQLQPEAKLPVKVSPKVQQQFDAVREQARRKRTKSESGRPVADAKPAPSRLSISGVELAQREQAKQETVSREQTMQWVAHLGTEAEPETERPATGGSPRPDAPLRELVTQAEVVPSKPSEAARERVAPVESESVLMGTSAAPGAEVPGHSLRSRAWLPASAGGVLLVAGGASLLMARSEASRLDSNDPRLATREDVEASVSRGRVFQTVGMGLVGAGVLGLGIAGFMYLDGVPSEPETVGLGVSSDGTSAFVYGRLP